MEIWKNIAGYEGYYQVSNLGRVKSFHKIKDGQLMTIFTKSFYPQLVLKLNGTKVKHFVHRLVAQAFIPNPENKPQVNHINGDRYDNNVSNLEWVTASENGWHAVRTGLRGGNPGEKNPNHRLKDNEILEIRKLASDGVGHVDIAQMFNTTRRYINVIIKRKRRNNI